RQLVPGLLADRRALPDRGSDRWLAGCDPRDRQRDDATAPRFQFAAMLELGGGIEADDGNRLETGIAAPDRGISAFQAARLHDLAKRRQPADRVEVGILLHTAVVRVPVGDGGLEQANRPILQGLALRRIAAPESLRRQSVSTSGVVMQRR